MHDLVLHNYLCPGDIVVMTAAIRDLHLAHPGQFRTDFRGTAKEILENNPHITPLDAGDASVGRAHRWWSANSDHLPFRDPETDITHIKMHYELIHSSNEGAYHFLHGMVFHLEQVLGVRIPMTKLKGDIHLSEPEKSWTCQVAGGQIGWDRDFWIMMAGGKSDFPCKWWDPARYQAVVDAFAGCIQFVQCGEAGHWHKPLRNVINLVGKTSTRQFIRLMYHASGVICPVTFAMHLAVAVPTKPGRLKNRPCVVIAGGREPAQWAAYPHHRFLNTNAAIDCCDQGGCWKAKCGANHRGGGVCVYPIQVSSELAIPKCMMMIEVEDVCRAIDQYHRGGACKYL